MLKSDQCGAAVFSKLLNAVGYDNDIKEYHLCTNMKK